MFGSEPHPDHPVFAAVLCAEERTPEFSGLLVDRQRVYFPLCLDLPLGITDDVPLLVGRLERVPLAVAFELGLLGFVLDAPSRRTFPSKRMPHCPERLAGESTARVSIVIVLPLSYKLVVRRNVR